MLVSEPLNSVNIGLLVFVRYYGDVSAENTLRNIAPLHQTGDMHAAIYDYGSEFM